MEEENKPEETKPDYFKALEELKKEREAIDAARKEAERVRDELAQLRAADVLGGSTDNAQAQEKPKEETAKEYADRIMKGQI